MRSVLSHPWCVVLTIPLLVALVGVVTGAYVYRSMRSMLLEMAGARFSDSAASASTHAQALFMQGPEILSSLRLDVESGEAVVTFQLGTRFVEIMRHRPGVAWLSYSSPEGRFVGVSRLGTSAFLLTEQEVLREGVTRHRAWEQAGSSWQLVRDDEADDYDPRLRPFYQVATQTEGIAWTAPYVFFNRGVPGISAVQGVRDPLGRLVGVLTVDFDVSSLSAALTASAEASGVHMFLYTDADALLALSGARFDATPGRGSEGELAALAAFADPMVGAYFAARPSVEEARGRFPVEVAGEVFLAREASFSPDGQHAWFVGAMAPQARLMAPATAMTRSSLWLGLGGLLLVMAVSGVYARHIAWARGVAAEAKAEASEARQRLVEVGSYRLVRKLGAGGMGEVWEAEHVLLARPAAIKWIRRGSKGVAGEEANARFKREALATARLTSLHTIKVFDFGVSEEGDFFYVMELLDGADLDTLVRQCGPFPAGRVVHVLMQVCASLAEAHEAGLIHRDVKPANIYLCKQGVAHDVVKVLDFGLVEEVGAEEEQRVFQGGTPAYMAPEAITGGEIDGRSDLYSLGCVGYWLLTGSAVFSAPSPSAMLMQQVQAMPERPTLRLGREDLRDVEAVIMACLAKDPQDRPADALHLLRLLGEVNVPADQQWSQGFARRWWQEYGEAQAGLDLLAAYQEEKTLVRKDLGGPGPWQH